MERVFFGIGAMVALLAVAAGAFGTHALASRLSPERLQTWELAARYQIYHALALLACAWAVARWPGVPARAAGYAFMAGLVIFCGTVYALALGAPRWLGAITPIGGLAFMIGWALLALAALRA